MWVTTDKGCGVLLSSKEAKTVHLCRANILRSGSSSTVKFNIINLNNSCRSTKDKSIPDSYGPQIHKSLTGNIS